MSGFIVFRRGEMTFTAALLCAALATFLGPAAAFASTVRITKASASPTYVSRYVSPKHVAIRYKLSARAYVTITVSSSSGTVKRVASRVRRSAGYHTAYWHLTTSTGAWAKNGRYKISISAKDRSGHRSSPYPARVYTTIDNTKPSGLIQSVSPYSISTSVGETATVTYRLSDNRTTDKLRATLEILNTSGTVVRSIVQNAVVQGAGKQFFWNGSTSSGSAVNPGAYDLRVRIRDLAGNQYVSPTGVSTTLHVNAWSRERPLDTTAYTQVIMRSDTRGDRTHVVWNDGSATGDRIRYRRVDRFGNTVVAPVVVAATLFDQTVSQARGVPDVSADANGGAYVVWRGTGRSISYKGIWLARIDSTGRVVWSKRILSETSSTYNILDPRVSASADGLVHVVCWKEGAPNAIYYAAFRSDGNDHIGWTALATGDVGGQRKLPNIEVDESERVHVAWYDAIDHPGTSYVGYRELYYTRLVFDDGYVSDAGSNGTISRKRLTTTTTKGYSPEYWDAPEMAVDSAGSLHVAWPDKVTATSSDGIRYLKLANSGEIVVASKVVLDGSTSSPGPRFGRNQSIAALSGGGARVVCSARAGITSPYRLWQVDVSSAGAPGKPFCITDSGGRTVSTAEDAFASLGTDSHGVTHLVYAADTGVPLSGATQQRVVHKDLASDSVSNDVTRGDLQIDAAHVVHVSSPAPPKQNTPVTVQVEVRNAGWAPMLGGSATLWFEGAMAGAPVSIPPLGVEATAVVSLPWTVPDDATRTPAALVVGVAPLGETEQTASTNDTASVPMRFLIPPDETYVIVEVLDETNGDYHITDVPTPTVTLSGTTLGGAPYLSTGTEISGRTEFARVPLGTYTVSHAKTGYIVSPPPSKTVTISRDPDDRYRLITTPSNVIQLWMNQWGTLEGTVTQSLGTTPVVGAKVTMLESDVTSMTTSGGFYRFTRQCQGPVTLRVTKAGYERRLIAVQISPSITTTCNVSLVPTTTGYLVGSVTDEGGYPIVNDPDTTTDDPSVTVKRTGFSHTYAVPNGQLDIKLTEGSYTLDFSAPGYKPVTGVPLTVVAGEEVDGSSEMILNVSSLTHKSSPERWVAPWTLHANWFGDGFEVGDFSLESFDIFQWYGLFRFTFNGDYQRVGLNDYIRYVKPRFVGEMFEWTYFFGVDPPIAPKVFRYEQDLAGLYDDRFQPPMLNSTTRWNRTGVRVDGIDIVDQRDGSVVSKIRSQWNSCREPDGHLYGSVTDAATGDQAFPAYTHVVPMNQQVVRLWLTVGQMTSDGDFQGARFGDLGRFNQGQLMNATGYNKLQLLWRPSDNSLWVEPALVDYPVIPGG